MNASNFSVFIFSKTDKRFCVRTSFLSKFSTFLTRDWKASTEWCVGVPRFFSDFISVHYACVPFAFLNRASNTGILLMHKRIINGTKTVCSKFIIFMHNVVHDVGVMKKYLLFRSSTLMRLRASSITSFSSSVFHRFSSDDRQKGQSLSVMKLPSLLEKAPSLSWRPN